MHIKTPWGYTWAIMIRPCKYDLVRFDRAPFSCFYLTLWRLRIYRQLTRWL